MEPILTLHKVSAGYNGKAVLKDVSVSIPKNQITALSGPSGCGKSTLLKCINRLLEEEYETFINGEILLAGQNIFNMPKEELRKKAGLVFQTPTPFPLSIYKNMTYAPKYYGIRDKRELNKIVKEKLEMAGLYEEVKDELHKNALQLSGGQQQRLCIGRALTAEPTILLLDEPCSALDAKNTERIEQMLLKLKENYTIVLVTHNMNQAKRISENILYMEQGEIIAEEKTV